ncbi:MAG TPA: extracellular solute-binding protein [Clostridia bacterium]
MKICKIIFVVFSLMAVLTGCEKSNIKPASNNIKVEVSKKITLSTNRGDRQEQLENLAEEFTRENPEIKVEIEYLPDYERTYKARLAVNEFTDITVTPGVSENMPNYFTPLDDVGFTRDDFKIELPLLNGHLYALPVGVGYDGVIYNKTAFKAAGITKIPSTLNELNDVCGKLKGKGIIPFAINAKDRWPTVWFIRRYPKMLLDDTDYEDKITYKDEFLSSESPVVNILNTLKDMYRKSYLEPDITESDYTQMIKDMAQGKVAMTFLGSWFISQLEESGAKPEDVGMFPFPGVKSIILDNDLPYAISKNSKNIAEAELFMKFAWADSRISSAVGQPSPFKNSEDEMEQIKELLSFNIPAKPMIADERRYNEIIEASGLNVNNLCLDYLLSQNSDDVIKSYNERWMKARKKLGY